MFPTNKLPGAACPVSLSGGSTQKFFLLRKRFPQEKPLCQHGHCDMVMPSQIAPAFIVIEPQLLFESLVALLDPPSHLGKKDEAAKPCMRVQVGKPIFRGRRLPLGPFDKQPLPGRALFDLSRPVSRNYSDSGKTRNEPTLGSLAPFNRLPHVGREFESKVFNRKNTHFVSQVIGSRGRLLGALFSGVHKRQWSWLRFRLHKKAPDQ